MEKIKSKRENKNKRNVEERRNLEVEKELEDKRERNRCVNKMSLNVNKKIRNQQRENVLQAHIELLTKIRTMMVPAMIGPLGPSVATA